MAWIADTYDAFHPGEHRQHGLRDRQAASARAASAAAREATGRGVVYALREVFRRPRS